MYKLIRKIMFLTLSLVISAQAFSHDYSEHIIGVIHNLSSIWNLLYITLLVTMLVVVMRYFSRTLSK